MRRHALQLGISVAFLLLWAAPATAQVCQYANDGECDEPGIGTSVCEAGTDTADCSQLNVADGYLYGALACAASYCGEAWGLVVDQTTASGAHKGALEQCGDSTCILEVTFSRGRCLAVATSEKYGAHGWATRSSLAEAEADALSNCNDSQGENCQIVASACSSG